jgi:hypothetical protein
MSIDVRISDKPFIADITFKDGSLPRRIDYASFKLHNGFFHFLANANGDGLIIAINADIVATVEVDDAAQTVGGTQ